LSNPDLSDGGSRQPDSGHLDPGDVVTVARTILAAIAEDPLMRPSYRIKARDHLKKLGAA
jgi:hypothetical protein